ncbi:hypothetical protein IV203_038518 [Nitzschia inconspicua]|uniref:Uncharacterized protein n=1 Tax=Nitzschia inconspicua TaxID=303405 RepID=A0A9K3LMR9_9STRA|nr:hypothetical protein IV203_038518 [Nitzschia inconspicua]
MTTSNTTSLRSRSMTMRIFMALLLFASSLQDVCHGFVQRPSTAAASLKLPSPRASTVNRVAVVDPVVDPNLEAESLTVMAHLALDFSGFVMSPSRSLFRLFAVLGRIFAISADYVVDHSIHTEELMIQLFLISVALKDWLYPAAVTSSSSTSSETKQ